MAINYFIGRSQEWLEAELAKAQDDLAAGKSITAASSGDVSKSERIEKSIEERIRMILQALSLLDPATYPPASVTAITTFKVSF